MSRQRILDSAREFVFAHGIDALSVRSLAQELRVTPTAIYRHVPGRQALLDALQPLPAGSVEDDRPPVSEAGLGLAQIVQEALTLASNQGIEGLSMRTLAKRLGVTPMSIYRYVENKAALLSAMTDAILDGLPHPEVTPNNWEACFREHAHAKWTRFSAYPGLVGAFASGPSPCVLQHMAYERSLLIAGGATPHTASVAITVYHTFMLGLFRSHAYLDLLARNEVQGVDPSRIRRYGEKLQLTELLDFTLAAVVAQVQQESTAVQRATDERP